MRHVSVCLSEVPDSQPSLKFTPYENPVKISNKPPQESSVAPEIKEQAKAAKPAKERKNIETKVKGRTHARTIEVSPPSNKLFSGKAVWGPGGYVRDRGQSGSVESSSKSDSSSRSSGSDRQTVVKTKAEVRESENLCGSLLFFFFFRQRVFFFPLSNERLNSKCIEKVTSSRTEKLRPYEKILMRGIVLLSFVILYIFVILKYI